MNKRGLILIVGVALFLLVNCLTFVLSEEIQGLNGIENYIDTSKVQIDGQDVNYEPAEGAQISSGGEAVTINFVEGSALYLNGKVYENLSKGYMVLDGEGNIIEFRGTIGKNKSVMIFGKTKYIFPPTSNINYKDGKTNVDCNYFRPYSILIENNNRWMNITPLLGTHINLEYFDNGEFNIKCHRFSINDYSIYYNSLTGTHIPEAMFDKFGRIIQLSSEASVKSSKWLFSNFGKNNLKFYYEENFDFSKHSGENYANFNGNKLNLGGFDFKVSSLSAKFPIKLYPSFGRIDASMEDNQMVINSFEDASITLENFKVLKTSDNGKIYKTISRASNSASGGISEVIVNAYGGQNMIQSTVTRNNLGIFSAGSFDLVSQEDLEGPSEAPFSARDLDREEFAKTGITPELRAGYVKGLSEFFYKLVYPAGYSEYNYALKKPYAYLKRLLSEGRAEGIKTRAEGNSISENRDDVWRLYLGFPQTRDTFGISRYQPAKSKEDRYYYNINYKGKLQSEDIFRILNNIDGEVDNPSIEPPIRVNANTVITKIEINYEVLPGLGYYTLSRSMDSCGSYISYYDLWDMEPNKIEGYLGTPLEIYDRIYYNSVTYEPLKKQPEGNCN